MDLIELQQVWKETNDEKVEVNSEMILKSIHKQSKSDLAVIQRKLRLKFIMASLAIFSIIILLSIIPNDPLSDLVSAGESAVLYSLAGLVIAVVLIFNYMALKKIKALQASSTNLKESLRNFIKTMETAIRFTIYSETFVTPSIVGWIYYAYSSQLHSIPENIRIALLFITPATIGILAFVLAQFTQRLKFGAYLDRLKGYLASLEEK